MADIEEQIPSWLAGVAVDPKLIPSIRVVYQREIKQVTESDHEESVAQLKKRLSELNEEEVRLARMMVTGVVGEDAYKQLRLEWQEKKINVQCKLDELQINAKQYLDGLEVALVLLSTTSKLFERLEDKQKTNLLQIIVKRIIINSQGEIIGHVLHSPFSYLSTLIHQHKADNGEGCGSELIRLGSQLEPLIDVELFLSMLQFDSREKLKNLPFELEKSLSFFSIFGSSPLSSCLNFSNYSDR